MRCSFLLLKSLYHMSVCNVNFKLNPISIVLRKKTLFTLLILQILSEVC